MHPAGAAASLALTVPRARRVPRSLSVMLLAQGTAAAQVAGSVTTSKVAVVSTVPPAPGAQVVTRIGPSAAEAGTFTDILVELGATPVAVAFAPYGANCTFAPTGPAAGLSSPEF